MKCISSPALDDTQIARYIEGEADQAVVAHIKECPFCSERAREWTLLQNRLRKQLYRFNCPTSMELGDYHQGYLPDPQKLVVAQHLRDCALCRQEMTELESFFTDLTPQSSLLETAQVLIARLISGRAETGLATALRGEVKGPLTFEAGSVVIVLDIQSAMEGKFGILGQVAAEDQEQWTDAMVELRQDNELQFSTTVDDLGAFHFEDIHTGSIQFTIRSKDGVLIRSPDVEIAG